MAFPVLTPPTLPPERAGYPAPPDLAARRAAMAGAALAMPRSAAVCEQVLAGVRVLSVEPSAVSRGVVLHLHGGAFRIGAPEFVTGFAVALAERCAVSVICPAYRLAPDHPFPAALLDARAVMLALQKTSDLPLILSGDSAGGGLAASLGLLSVADVRPPAGVVLFSPWLDLTVSDAAYDDNAGTDPLFSRGAAEEAAGLYLQGQSAREPLISPLLAPLAGFPPAFISVGEGEVLVQDARRFDAALDAAGGACELHVIPGMEHVAVVRSLHLPGSAETLTAVAGFLERRLA